MFALQEIRYWLAAGPCPQGAPLSRGPWHGAEARKDQPTGGEYRLSFDLVKCGMCGKAVVVQAGLRSVCDACRKEEQKLYMRVRSLLTDNERGALTVQDVAELLEVDEKQIVHLVESGFFQLVMKRIKLFD
jgi:hypothetical protein